MQVKWATKLAAPTSCFSIHCWYIYMAIKESCHTTKCIYRTTTYKAFPCLRICLALYFPPQSSSMYLLCYDRRSGDDTCTDVWELNDCKELKKLIKFGSLGHVASKIQSYSQKRNISIYIFNDRNGKLLLLVNHWLCLNSSHNFKQYYRSGEWRYNTCSYRVSQ